MNWVLLDAVFVPATKTFAVVDIVNAGSNMQLSDRGHLIDHSDFNKPQTFELGKLANADSNFLTTFVLSSLSPGETAKFLIRPNYATYKPGRQINRAYTITVTYKTATMKIVGISDKAITLAVPPKEYSLAVTGNTTGLAKIIQLLPKSFEGKYVRVVGNTSVKAEVFTNPDEVTLVDLVEGITDKECAL